MKYRDRTAFAAFAKLKYMHMFQFGFCIRELAAVDAFVKFILLCIIPYRK